MQRFLFSQYGQGKKPLPKKLEFLKSFKVHAIVRYSKDGQIKYRLELPSPQIKRLLDKLVSIKQLEKEKTHLINQLEIEKTKLETENKELVKEIETLNSRCELLRYELSDKTKAKQEKFDAASRGEKSPPSIFGKLSQYPLRPTKKQIGSGGI